MNYPITMNEKTVGVAVVYVEGLYQIIECECNNLGHELYKLKMEIANQIHPLGILLREGSLFFVKKKVPRKLIGDGIPRFIVYPICRDMNCEETELIVGKPIQSLGIVRAAKLSVRGEKKYLLH